MTSITQWHNRPQIVIGPAVRIGSFALLPTKAAPACVPAVPRKPTQTSLRGEALGGHLARLLPRWPDAALWFAKSEQAIEIHCCDDRAVCRKRKNRRH